MEKFLDGKVNKLKSQSVACLLCKSHQRQIAFTSSPLSLSLVLHLSLSLSLSLSLALHLQHGNLDNEKTG